MTPMVNRTRALVFATFLFAGGCAPRPGAVAAPAGAPPAAPPPLACQEVAGLEPLLAPGAGVLLGEMHGTTESPAFAANAVCLALRAGLPVMLALEIPRQEEARVEAFLASAGSAADRAALLAGPFWTRDYQDGRSSAAMLALLDEMRRLRRNGRPIRVKLLDRTDPPADSEERDRWLAEALGQAFEEASGSVVISLTGNVHSRIAPGTPWNPEYKPAGYVLLGLKPDLRLTSLDVSYQGGTAWICTSAEASSCQARSLHGRGDAQAGRVVLLPQVTNGHNGVYNVGALTASPPAAQPASAAE